jgi:hypothetical protein
MYANKNPSCDISNESLIALVAAGAARNTVDSSADPSTSQPLANAQPRGTVVDTASPAPSRAGGNVAVAVALSGVNTLLGTLATLPTTEGLVPGGTAADAPPVVNAPTSTLSQPAPAVAPPVVNTPTSRHNVPASPVASSSNAYDDPMTPAQLTQYVNALPDEGRWYLVIRGTEPGIYTSW